MKRTKGRNLSPRANKVLLVLNIVLFLGAIVLAILNVDLKEYKRRKYLRLLETSERKALIP